MTKREFGILEKYLRHLSTCPAGYYQSCVCGHMTNQHFTHGSHPCAHCECAKFKNGECSCGLLEVMEKFL